MKTILIVMAAMMCMQSASARQRAHVVIHKQPPVQSQRPSLSPAGGAVIVVPPLALLYDLQRRTSCSVPADYLGLGGPGFDRPVTPKEGNVMIPAWQRGACN